MVSTRQTELSTWKHFTCTEILLSTSMHKSKGKRKKWDSCVKVGLIWIWGSLVGFFWLLCVSEEIKHYRKSKVVSPREYQSLLLWAEPHTSAQGMTWPGTTRAPLVFQCPEQERLCKYLNSNCSNWDRECKPNSFLATQEHFPEGISFHCLYNQDSLHAPQILHRIPAEGWPLIKVVIREAQSLFRNNKPRKEQNYQLFLPWLITDLISQYSWKFIYLLQQWVHCFIKIMSLILLFDLKECEYYFFSHKFKLDCCLVTTKM